MNPITYTIERVSDNGRRDARGKAYGRKATTIATTTDPAEAIDMRITAAAALQRGSSEWIEVHAS